MLLVVLAAVAVLVGVVAAAGVASLAGAEHRQSLYRRRLLAGPMHQHNGRPCYSPVCAPDREEVTV